MTSTPLPPRQLSTPNAAAKPSRARSIGKQLLPLLGGAIFGAAFATVGFGWIDAIVSPVVSRLGLLTLPLALVLALLGAVTAVALHELGHLIGGTVAGFRLVLFSVGPFTVRRDEDGRRSFELNTKVNATGGMVSMVPVRLDHARKGMLMLVAGGPLASLASALPLLALAGQLTGRYPISALAVGFAGAISLLFVFASLAPITAGGFLSDGARLLRMARGGPLAERDSAMWCVTGLQTSGVLPRDWPPELVRTASLEIDGTQQEAFGILLAHQHLADSGDIEGAAAKLERALALRARVLPALLPHMMLPAAWFEAHYRGNARLAREYFSEVPANAFAMKSFERDAVRAAIALAEGDGDEAHRIATEALREVPKMAVVTRSRLEEISAAGSVAPVGS